jgi:AcrR family transcriptional regulator
MIKMEKFESLDKTKKKRIINAALKEFAAKGFDQASTNQIVKEAGIGKGMLFYYFKSKKDLYFYLINYCTGVIEEKYFSRIDISERNLFQRLKDISLIKMTFLNTYPDAMNFMAAILLRDEELDSELRKRVERLHETGYGIMYDNLDYGLFRNDIDSGRVIRLIEWTFRGYEEELKYRLRDEDVANLDYQPYFDDFFAYLDVLETAFYVKS